MSPAAPPPDVLKLGGSLFDLAGLPELVAAHVREDRLTIVVPGGGPVVDAVRGLGPTLRSTLAEVDAAAADHRVSLLVCDATAEWAAARLGVRRVTSLSDAAAGVVVASASLGDRGDLPADWSVTSDTLAAVIARRVGARQLTILKSVGPLSSLADAEEAGHIDAGFTGRTAGMTVVWVNGRTGRSRRFPARPLGNAAAPSLHSRA